MGRESKYEEKTRLEKEENEGGERDMPRARSKPDRHKRQESRTYRKKGKMSIKKNRFD